MGSGRTGRTGNGIGAGKYFDDHPEEFGTSMAPEKVNATATIKYDGKGGIQPVDPALRFSDESIIRQRRRINRLNNPEPLPPDLADVAERQRGSSSVLTARRGSRRSALGTVFDPTAPLGRYSILGDF